MNSSIPPVQQHYRDDDYASIHSSTIGLHLSSGGGGGVGSNNDPQHHRSLQQPENMESQDAATTSSTTTVPGSNSGDVVIVVNSDDNEEEEEEEDDEVDSNLPLAGDDHQLVVAIGDVCIDTESDFGPMMMDSPKQQRQRGYHHSESSGEEV